MDKTFHICTVPAGAGKSFLGYLQNYYRGTVPLLEEDERGIKKFKIIRVSNRFDEHIADYSQDYIKIKDLALKEKQLSKIKDWMVEKIDETYININQDNKDCNFTNKWVKN